MARLRRLSEHCDVGFNLTVHTLRDGFVNELHNENIQKKLLTERVLRFTCTTEIATSVEAVAKDTVELQQQMAQECTVHEIDKIQQRSIVEKFTHTSRLF